MAGDEHNCPCGGGTATGTCPGCDVEEPLQYWCEICQQFVAEKRCPLCGLKARKVRNGRERSR